MHLGSDECNGDVTVTFTGKYNEGKENKRAKKASSQIILIGETTTTTSKHIVMK